MGNVEIVLSSVVVFFATFVIARTMWYGSTTTLQNYLVPPTINGIRDFPNMKQIERFVPVKLKILTFYDYIGNNPAKGGLFRVGTMDNGNGITVGWLGDGVFKDKE